MIAFVFGIAAGVALDQANTRGWLKIAVYWTAAQVVAGVKALRGKS